MANLISINEAILRGISKLRLPRWKDQNDHIELHLMLDGCGPWIKVWSAGLPACGMKNPHEVLITEFNLAKVEWLAY